jgi:hypothetical protein
MNQAKKLLSKQQKTIPVSSVVNSIVAKKKSKPRAANDFGSSEMYLDAPDVYGETDAEALDE